MSKILVVYFSMTGHTETVALAIAELLGADIEAIRPSGSYTGMLGALKGMWQHFTQTAPRLQAGRAPERYELVVVGSPVWGGRLAAPVRGYLKSQGGRIRAVAGFWVSRSGQAYPAIGREMQRLTAKAPRATLALSDPDVKTGRHAERVAMFVAGLQKE